MSRKNWIAVASAEHARRGCATPAGYRQVCHGKLAPIRRLQPGDRVAYYAPTVPMGGKDSCQSFVSIGIVQTGQPYAFRDAGPPQASTAPEGLEPAAPNLLEQVWTGDRGEASREPRPARPRAAHEVASVGATFDMSSGFVPFRRNVAYVPAQEASILPLLDDFEFVENRQRWGYKFRFGLFGVSDHDMRLIAQAMVADFDLLCF